MKLSSKTLIIACFWFLALAVSVHQIQAKWFNVFSISEDSTSSSPSLNDLDDEDDEFDIQTIKEVDPIEPFGNQEQKDTRRDQQHSDGVATYASSMDLRREDPLTTYGQDPRTADQQHDAGYSIMVEAEPSAREGYSEPDQKCGENQYMCRKVSPDQQHIRCIPDSWKCNGIRDCEENDDEDSCDGRINLQHQYSQGQQQCAPGQHLCYGTGVQGIPAQCLERQQICDLRNDCPYADDERSCLDDSQQGGYGQQHGGDLDLHGQQQNLMYPGYGQQKNLYSQQQLQPGQFGYDQSKQQQTTTHGSQQEHNDRQQYAGRDLKQKHHQSSSNGSSQDICRSEEYIKRLEFLDRCYRSCMRHQF